MKIILKNNKIIETVLDDAEPRTIETGYVVKFIPDNFRWNPPKSRMEPDEYGNLVEVLVDRIEIGDPNPTSHLNSEQQTWASGREAKIQAFIDNLPSWAVVETAINNIDSWAKARSILLKLARVVYWLAKNKVK